MTQPRFALIGAAGFVAPRHMQALKDVGGKLVAALDPHDSVGILDRFDRETEFFTEPERFERHLEKLRRAGNGIDWLTVCSPNHLHDTHIRMGLRAGAKVICEKPLVLDPRNLDALADIEKEFCEHADERRVFTVLQLRHAEKLGALRRHWKAEPPLSAKLHYATPRGKWYERSWKGDPEKSGGLLTNIGIHMFDFLIWVFGPCVPHGDCAVGRPSQLNGVLRFGNTTVTWDLSIENTTTERAERWIEVNGARTSFDGFEDLHTTVYRETLAGRGHGIEDARPSVELAARLRKG